MQRIQSRHLPNAGHFPRKIRIKTSSQTKDQEEEECGSARRCEECSRQRQVCSASKVPGAAAVDSTLGSAPCQGGSSCLGTERVHDRCGSVGGAEEHGLHNWRKTSDYNTFRFEGISNGTFQFRNHSDMLFFSLHSERLYISSHHVT